MTTNDNQKQDQVDRIEVIKARNGYIIRTWKKGAECFSPADDVDVSSSLPDLVERIVEHLQWEYV